MFVGEEKLVGGGGAFWPLPILNRVKLVSGSSYALFEQHAEIYVIKSLFHDGQLCVAIIVVLSH